jgi:hypothetical protein
MQSQIPQPAHEQDGPKSPGSECRLVVRPIRLCCLSISYHVNHLLIHQYHGASNVSPVSCEDLTANSYREDNGRVFQAVSDDYAVSTFPRFKPNLQYADTPSFLQVR